MQMYALSCFAQLVLTWKQGLVDAASDSDGIKELANCVRRIAFLGTPHQGSDKARWAETARRFVQFFKETNPELSKDLNEKSEKLAKLGVQFPNLLNSRSQSPETKIEVVCFFEGKSTTVGGVNFDKVCQFKCVFQISTNKNL